MEIAFDGSATLHLHSSPYTTVAARPPKAPIIAATQNGAANGAADIATRPARPPTVQVRILALPRTKHIKPTADIAPQAVAVDRLIKPFNQSVVSEWSTGMLIIPMYANHPAHRTRNPSVAENGRTNIGLDSFVTLDVYRLAMIATSPPTK